MNAVEKICLNLCEEIFSISSVTDKTVLNYSIKLLQDKDEIAEVILFTKEDEYTFVLDLTEKEVYSEDERHLYNCSKCATENKYNLKHIDIKGFDAVKIGKIDLKYLKIILEKLAEDHAKCIEENNLEKTNYKTGVFSVAEENQESYKEIMHQILDENNKGSIDLNIFLEGINTIEKLFQNALQTNQEYVYVYSNILHKKLYVKRDANGFIKEYKILNIRTEQSFPLVYDLLLTIFSFTDQNMRQNFFHELLEHYYEILKHNLGKLCLDITKCLPLTSFQKQAHQFNSYVKLHILKQLCHSFTTDSKNNNQHLVEQHKITIWLSILEVNECILFPNLSKEDCYTIIRNKIDSSNYTLLNYKLLTLDQREGYLGDYFKLKIEIKYNGENKLLHLFTKYLPTYNKALNTLALNSFKKEEFYYLKLIPTLNDLGLSDITDFLPKCYFSRTNDVLVFEDMSVLNYKSFHVSVPYTYEFLLMTLKQLAKLHACSLLYEELMSENNKDVRLDIDFPEYIEEINYTNTKETPLTKMFGCAINTFLAMLSVCPDIPKKLSMNEFKKRAEMVFDTSFKKVERNEKFRNVICQGDCWSSNILFKTDKNFPVDCCLVDYQLIRYCPPMHDIYFFLYMGTTKEIRRKFESKLLEEYYTELSNILQKYKVDLQQIYTYQEFLDCCNYMRSQGLCHAIIVLQFVLFPQEKLNMILEDKEQTKRLLEVNRDIFIEELKNDGDYTRRMKDLIEEMYEICERNCF